MFWGWLSKPLPIERRRDMPSEVLRLNVNTLGPYMQMTPWGKVRHVGEDDDALVLRYSNGKRFGCPMVPSRV